MFLYIFPDLLLVVQILALSVVAFGDRPNPSERLPNRVTERGGELRRRSQALVIHTELSCALPCPVVTCTV